jgi:hypothetical protein
MYEDTLALWHELLGVRGNISDYERIGEVHGLVCEPIQ